MQYYRCKCGKAEMWNSGEPVFDCMGCEKCQTTYAQNEKGHKELKPHDFDNIEEKKLVNGEEKSVRHYRQCKVCHHREYIKK